MPAYHSKIFTEDAPILCSCAILPIKTKIRGPSAPANSEEDDIIDECLAYFRANVLFRNFELQGPSDKTLVYLTMYTQQCLKELEKVETREQALSVLADLAYRRFIIPGDRNWPLPQIYSPPESSDEEEKFRTYFCQVRDELGQRLVSRIFQDEVKSKWWMAFAKRRFLNKELR
mmetsp:Transcript_12735/g.16740  ORF Transcript_12735/g.16740 Transcript_12735/m.16740 type:complete len:174 (+) Transcript_12735:140-661(+)